MKSPSSFPTAISSPHAQSRVTSPVSGIFDSQTTASLPAAGAATAPQAPDVHCGTFIPYGVPKSVECTRLALRSLSGGLPPVWSVGRVGEGFVARGRGPSGVELTAVGPTSELAIENLRAVCQRWQRAPVMQADRVSRRAARVSAAAWLLAACAVTFFVGRVLAVLLGVVPVTFEAFAPYYAIACLLIVGLFLAVDRSTP